MQIVYQILWITKLSIIKYSKEENDEMFNQFMKYNKNIIQ